MENLVVEPQRVRARVPVRRNLRLHGYLHGGTLVSVADSLCGYGTIVNLPDDATGFVTIELKSNFLGTIRHGAMLCKATRAHIGRTTQILGRRRNRRVRQPNALHLSLLAVDPARRELTHLIDSRLGVGIVRSRPL